MSNNKKKEEKKEEGDHMRGWTTDRFSKEKEFVPEERGEQNLHTRDAVERINRLEGTPVDSTTPPQPDVAPPSPASQIKEMKPPPDGMGRILICVITRGILPDLKFMESFLKLWTELTIRQTKNELKYEIGYHFVKGKPVHLAETFAVQVARTNKCSHIILMDDDIYDVTADMVNMLYEAEKDVITGVMRTSGFPYAQCIFRRHNTEATVSSQPSQKGLFRLYEVPCRCPFCFEEKIIANFPTWDTQWCYHCRKELPKDFPIQPIDLIPFPFTLIKMSVFERIKQPWFHCNTVFPTDSWFADRCIEAGIQEYVHMMIRFNHRGITDENFQHHFNMSLQETQKNGGVIELSPEQMEAHISMMEGKMNKAEELSHIRVKPDFLEKEKQEVKK